jgi:hypothetical protein
VPVPALSFHSSEGSVDRSVPVVARDEVLEDAAEGMLDRLEQVPWNRLDHAYGPAADVPVLLYATHVGTAEVRRAAWWELWGNIHHQGTVYEATVAAVPFLDEVARWPDHPDRVQALSFLREIALGDGSAADEVRDAVRPRAAALLAAWRDAPEVVQRALIWLATAFPELARQHEELLALVPPPLRAALDEAVASGGRRSELSEDAMDRQDELERWALAGWSED